MRLWPRAGYSTAGPLSFAKKSAAVLVDVIISLTVYSSEVLLNNYVEGIQSSSRDDSVGNVNSSINLVGSGVSFIG